MNSTRRPAHIGRDWEDQDGNSWENSPYQADEAAPTRPSLAEQRQARLAVQQSRHGAEIESAEAARKQSGLGPLKGSTAQKKWGEQLRQAFLSANPDLKDFVGADETMGKAKTWIDTRKDKPPVLRRKVVELRDASELVRQADHALSKSLAEKFPNLGPGDKFPIDAETNRLMQTRATAEKQVQKVVQRHFAPELQL